jgi:4-hydroxythreonine-4-phosphate dehydrogenase
MNTFIFTCGDLNGVGSELVIKTLNRVAPNSKNKFIFICPQNVFNIEINKIKPLFNFEIINSTKYSCDLPVSVINFGDFKRKLGIPTKQSGKAAYKALTIAYKISNNSLNKAIITAPISKIALAYAKINFPGHTEMLAEWYNVKSFVMMFLSNSIKAALLTIHQPIKRVPELITKDLMTSKFDVIIEALQNDFNIKSPKIAVLGLNPHAGESGLIGEEEKDIIIPTIKKFTKRKYLSGPFSPDAFFGMKMYMKFDVVVGMYHDQILNPFKLLNFNRGVNFTAGLPIVRTSPDHGTAFDIAGKGIADESSMVKAYHYARTILCNRKFNG